MKTTTKIAIVCGVLCLPLGACNSEANTGVAPAAAQIQDIEKAADDAAAKISPANADEELKKLKQEMGGR